MIDFQQVSLQVQQLGENAPRREQELQSARQKARLWLEQYAQEISYLRQKVDRATQHDDKLRCALPMEEALTAHFSLPPLPAALTLLAADGSQITPDRHSPVLFGLINVGAIQMRYGFPEAPIPTIQSKLLYDQAVYGLTEDTVALRRDLAERAVLADLAESVADPQALIITFTDGPVELWGAKGEDSPSEFRDSLNEYLTALKRLQRLGAVNAGYVDKPGADLVVRLLEVATIPEDQLANLRQHHPLRGVADADLFNDLLVPGERSAVFAMQSKSAEKYPGELGLCFFYLNVGRADAPWIARVEVPAWVAGTPAKLDALQAVLLDQCLIMGSRPYPYLLHRAHEAAVVTLEEQEQITQMIMLELRRRGVPVGEGSFKQAAKSLGARTRYKQ